MRLLSSPCFSDGALQIAGRGNTFSVECGMEWTGRTHGMSGSKRGYVSHVLWSNKNITKTQRGIQCSAVDVHCSLVA